MQQQLRIIIDPPRSAEFSMAADLYLLDRAGYEEMVFLRLYSWNPPAVSLGCMQNPDAILDFTALENAGVTWIKRPTGGRAVLHSGDLTYSCAFPKTMTAMGRTISETYLLISRCLIAGLAHAGIHCAVHDSHAEYAATKRILTLPCFLSPNRSEIMVSNKKLIGSAQKRTDFTVLQHGSIPFDGSFRHLPRFCKLDIWEQAAQMRTLEEKCTCVQEIDPAVKPNILSRCLIRGFCESLSCNWFEKPWDEREMEGIKALESSTTRKDRCPC